MFNLTSMEQYRTAEDLIARSRPNPTYSFLLAVSVVIIAAGLLLNNPSIVIGGMLVTPLLTPLLAIALGISIGEIAIVKRSAILIAKSLGIVVLFSFAMAVVLGTSQSVFEIENTMRVAILYFIVALASGVAATLAWVNKEISDTLPGIAIAVSLVPPLSYVGIWMSKLEFDAARFYLFVFLLNFSGIIIGSLIIFSLLRFYKAGEKIRKIKEPETAR